MNAYIELLQIQEILSVIDAKVLGKLDHVFVLDRIDPRQVGGKHIDLRRLLDGLDQTKGLI